MNLGLIDALCRLAIAKNTVAWELPHSYRSGESLLSDPVGARISVARNAVGHDAIRAMVRAFSDRRLLHAPWSDLQQQRVSDAVWMLCERTSGSEFPCPIVMWDFAARVVSSERRAPPIPMRFEERCTGIELASEIERGTAPSHVFSSAQLRRLRDLMPWTRLELAHDGSPATNAAGSSLRRLCCVRFEDEGIEETVPHEETTDFVELREHVGLVDLTVESDRVSAMGGIMPLQNGRCVEAPAGFGTQINEPFVTFMVVEEPSHDQLPSEPMAKAYTIHASPDDGTITAMIGYLANGERRLSSMPDAVRIVEALKKLAP